MNSIAMAVIVGTLAWISTGAPTSGPVSSRQKAESELLQLHLVELEAHRNANVEALLVNAQDGFVYVRDGKISRTNVSDTRESFRKSFKDTTYFLYEDIEPPIVRASEDGKLGWVIGRLRGRRSQKDSATGKDNSEDFVYAGIMTYELKGGKWYRVSNVSTFEPTP